MNHDFETPSYSCGRPYCPGKHPSKYMFCTDIEVQAGRAAVRAASTEGSNFQKYFGGGVKAKDDNEGF